jgi:hypothetical protein
MPLFVDHVGLNTLISEELSTDIDSTLPTNTRGAPIQRITQVALDASLRVASSDSNNPGLFANSVTGWPTSGALLFSFWVNLDNISNNTQSRYIFYGKNLTSYSNFIYFSNNIIYFFLRNGSGVAKFWQFTCQISDFIETWKHVVVSWAGDFSVDPRIYVDSISLTLISSGGTATGTTFLTTDGYRIFDNNNASPAFELAGRLQSFTIYTASDISLLPDAATLYNSGIIPDYNTIGNSYLLEYWLFGNESQFNSMFLNRSISEGTIIPSSGGTIGTSLTSSTNEVILSEGLESYSTPTRPAILDGFAGGINGASEFAALNTHRNGPYGYSSWRQLRVSENPITRYHNKNSTFTFVVQPGPVINVGQNGELRVRSRYSSIYSFKEPALTQKTYPLVWNVGRHFKDEDGQLAPEPQKFSIISSYGNQQLGFANEEVNKLLKFQPDDEQTEYRAISSMYLENGLNKQDSPLTYWEFLQYRETVFPIPSNQFRGETRGRPQFESFFRHNREDRTKLFATSSFGFSPRYTVDGTSFTYFDLSQSSWPLDESISFLTRTFSEPSASIDFLPDNPVTISRNGGEGQLLSTTQQFWSNMALFTSNTTMNSQNLSVVNAATRAFDIVMSPGPLYSRRISLSNSASVSNPSGMEIYGTSSTETLFQGGALWEAGANRYVKDESGNYVHSPKTPFYDTYEHYIEEAKKHGKNYAVIPEFRMSEQLEDYKRTDGGIELDMFEVTGGIEGSENSSKENFYTIYSNTDFMKNFEILNDDHKDFTNGKVLSLRCKAIKKFLPYEGFYPAQRTVDLAKRFYDSFKNNIKLYNANNVELSDFNYGRQMVMTPLFAPGVLFNTIKSGVAVDYPIITSILDSQPLGDGGQYFIYNNYFDKRIPFESLMEPHRYLAGYNLTSNEPHPSGNLSASANWDGNGDELYGLMTNNFLAEVPEFFLPNGEFTSITSKRQGDITLKSGSIYGMRIKMKRSMRETRGSVYHYGAEELSYYPPQDVGNNRESFTMYSRPSAFGPPTIGIQGWNDINLEGISSTVFSFDTEHEVIGSGSTSAWIYKDSNNGFNFSFTPPYYHGEAWCDVILTASSNKMTIEEIQESAQYNYTRFDSSFYRVQSGSVDYTISDAALTAGAQSLFEDRINKNAVQLSASLNIKGIGRSRDAIKRSRDQRLVVDSGLDEDNRWIIQTKFETPMLNFSHVSGSDHLTLPVYGSGSVPRGMWHQHGRIPEENEGVFLEVGPIERNYWTQARGETVELEDLSEVLGFSGTSTKIGRLAESKKISEAVVAVPFIENEGRKKFFRLPLTDAQLQSYKDGDREALTTGPAQSQIGRSVLLQMDKMSKFIFPPSFDFLNFKNAKRVAMYVFEFSHTLSQQDLSDIWQNLPPDIGTEMEVAEVAITHPLLQKELLGKGGEEGNQRIEMPSRLKWMVFKVKQRAASNYFKKTVLRNPEVNTAVASSNVTKDEFGETSAIQYNWPYDFFSLVELVKIDAEVEMGNFDEDAINNYTDNLPSWDGVSADLDKIEYIVGGLEDAPIPETVPEETPEESFVETTVAEKITTSDRLRNIGMKDSLAGKEGIFDVPNNIPQEDKNIYIQLKGRFTVEANKSPLESVQILTARAGGELLAIGVQVLNVSSTTDQAFLSWAQKWYNTDPTFQSKKAQAQAGASSAAGLNNTVEQQKKERWYETVETYAREVFRENRNSGYSNRNIRKAAEKALKAAEEKYGNHQYWDSIKTRLKNSIERWA